MFQPVVPIGGLAGWAFLQDTLARQTEAFDKSPVLTRDTEYFEANISQIRSAEDLVSDRRLLRVALGAFGLQDALNSRFLIRRILEEGTGEDALATRLTDERYTKLADAFGFDDAVPRTQELGFGAEIVAKYRAREFEIAIGNQDEAMRLALNADRELAEMAVSDDSDETRWFQIMGTPPLRQVFETVLGLPDGFGQLDIDRQLDIFQEKSRTRLGLDSLNDLADDDVRQELIRTYLLRDQIKSVSVVSSMSIALTLLQSSQSQT